MTSEHERLLQSMQDLSDSLSRLLAALQRLEARIAGINGPTLRVLRGGGRSAPVAAPLRPVTP